ncbi:MAG TPA: outer membrane protein assembly factor BamE [Caulobacteraceae bacterium]|jgi:outer membrane protein assembly factor BamE (lipoprotein component of BamABCDE complex)|nr:outer membrane protein assembly factor BamE [Caulobacteraceae bacterium]
MTVKPLAGLAALSLLGAAACTPVNSYQGFQAIDHSPSEIKVGQDTRATVQSKLGSPTSVSTFDKNTWFYLSQTSEVTGFYRPRVTRRDVTAIVFSKDGEKVSDIRSYTLKDGRVIAYNARETPTRGREMTVLEQLLGSISAAGALPPQEVNPGTHGGGGPGGP